MQMSQSGAETRFAGLSMACTLSRRDLEAMIPAELIAEVRRHRDLMSAQLGFFMPCHPSTLEIPGNLGDEEVRKTHADARTQTGNARVMPS